MGETFWFACFSVYDPILLQVLSPSLDARALSERFSLNNITKNDLHGGTKLLVGGGLMHLCCQTGWQNAGEGGGVI